MSLKKIKRAEKKGTESVMDEKFALLFWSEFAIGNGELSYQVHHLLKPMLLPFTELLFSQGVRPLSTCGGHRPWQPRAPRVGNNSVG